MARLELLLLGGVSLLAALTAGCGRKEGAGGGGGAKPDHLGPYPLSRFAIEKDRFLPATDPETVPAAKVTYLLPDDEVFGVVVEGRPRAYPITMIAYHHVVNDVIAGVPVAVTY